MSRKHLVKHYRKTLPLPEDDHNPLNYSWVTYRKRDAWRELFGDMTTDEIIQCINDVWIDPRYKLVPTNVTSLPLEVMEV